MALNDQRGVAILEIVLLMIVSLSLAKILVTGLQEMQFAQKLISSPWARVQGMIECGVWEPCRGVSAKHPNSVGRFITNQGETR